MRLFRVLPTAVVGVVLIGVVGLIVVEVANYDGRTAAEIARDEHGEDPASLEHCPKDEWGSSEEEHDPGTEGETVPPGPTSALICSWSQKDVRAEGVKFVLSEKVLHFRGDLTKLTDALNSLPPVTPLPEGEYACPSEEAYYALVGLRYKGASEVQVAIGPALCGGYAALNLHDQREYVATPTFLRLLNALLEKGS
jgi:hypothetical protein